MNKPKIFVDYKNNRFINGLIGSQSTEVDILHAHINKNIYNAYHVLHFDYCVFNLSSLDNELVQFISEYASQIKIFIYFDVQGYTDTGLIDNFKDAIYYLVPENTYNNYMNYNNVIKINNNLINEHIFHEDKDGVKDESICFFLDLWDSVPEQLKDKLYPQTKMKIRMYNNPKIKHSQNLGGLSETDKAYILNKSSYFINYNDYYLFEAMNCGCKILDINDVDTEKCITIDKATTNYDNFLKEYIL
jgi:hypothetical protein